MQQAQLEPYKVCSPVYFDGRWWVISEVTDINYRLTEIIPKVFYPQKQNRNTPQRIYFNYSHRALGSIERKYQRFEANKILDIGDRIYFKVGEKIGSGTLILANCLDDDKSLVTMIKTDNGDHIGLKPENVFYYREID